MKAEELARNIERNGENEASVNELLYSFARNCAQFVINIRDEISKLETRAAKAYYIKQNNEFVATPPQITSARDWLVKEEQDRKETGGAKLVPVAITISLGQPKK